MTKTETISLLDYNNDAKPVTYLWICGVGCPTGTEYRHGETDDDYCNVTEVISDLDLWDLTGNVVDGRWEWDGEGSPTDQRGNSIYNIKAI